MSPRRWGLGEEPAADYPPPRCRFRSVPKGCGPGRAGVTGSPGREQRHMGVGRLEWWRWQGMIGKLWTPGQGGGPWRTGPSCPLPCAWGNGGPFSLGPSPFPSPRVLSSQGGSITSLAGARNDPAGSVLGRVARLNGCWQAASAGGGRGSTPLPGSCHSELPWCRPPPPPGAWEFPVEAFPLRRVREEPLQKPGLGREKGNRRLGSWADHRTTHDAATLPMVPCWGDALAGCPPGSVFLFPWPGTGWHRASSAMRAVQTLCHKPPASWLSHGSSCRGGVGVGAVLAAKGAHQPSCPVWVRGAVLCLSDQLMVVWTGQEQLG